MNPSDSREITPHRAMVTALMEAMLDAAENAASCSHRPTHVEHIFLDANSRHYMAQAILDMPEMQAIKRFVNMVELDVGFYGLPESVVEWVLS